MNLEKIEKIIANLGESEFRLEQVRKAVFEDNIGSFWEIFTLPKNLREILAQDVEMLSFKVEKVLVSKDGKSIKALLKLKDGEKIETVLISPKGRFWAACISSQVGCVLSCDFCGTGKMGFKRDLTKEEITDQVLFWKMFFGPSFREFVIKDGDKIELEGGLTNIVLMGMGEPFLNWENVKKALEDLICEKLFNFVARGISVSTAGIPEGIENLAKDFPQVNLAISLHFADQEKRQKMMPIGKKYDLKKLKKSLQEYFIKTKRKVFIEYLMLDEINDSEEDAQKLADYLKSIGKNHLLHVNLIAYNQTGKKYQASFKNQIARFRGVLEKNKIKSTTRKSLGDEVKGACGQLVS